MRPADPISKGIRDAFVAGGWPEAVQRESASAEARGAASAREAIAKGVEAIDCPRRCQGEACQRGHLPWCPKAIAARIRAGEI